MKNRQLKFRVWNGKQMYYQTGSIMYDDMIAFEFDPFKNEPDYGMEVMQFTGLYDKNGKEIYEGDIIPIYDIEMKLHNAVVKYCIEDGAYIVAYEDPVLLDDMYYMLADLFDLEVVGNIYENEYLLNQ